MVPFVFPGAPHIRESRRHVVNLELHFRLDNNEIVWFHLVGTRCTLRTLVHESCVLDDRLGCSSCFPTGRS